MNTLEHPISPTIDGEIGISADYNLATRSGAATVLFGGGDSLSDLEADAQYFTPDNMPITRVGDMSYLPMDIKGDFRGAIQPWGHLPYFLKEADGSVVLLRPGYNGEYISTFYGYSQNGSLTPADVRMTDSEYRPPFLADDEYVTKIVDSSTTGFLCLIRSKVSLSIARYFWIEHNGTLDARFHTYLDVTTTFSASLSGEVSSANGGANYIPSLNLFVVLASNAKNKMVFAWYLVDRSLQSTYQPGNAAVLPTKSVNWSDMSGVETGTTNQAVIFDATTSLKQDRYFKIVDAPGAVTAFNPIHSSAGSRHLSHVISSTGTVRFFVPLFMYISFPANSANWGWTISMDYNPSTNTFAITPPGTDLTRFQSLPYVISAGNTTVDTSAPPQTITDDYKRNKLPLIAYTKAFPVGNYVSDLSFLDETTVLAFVGSNQVSVFSVHSYTTNYTGATLQDRRFTALGYFDPDQVTASNSYSAIDASILSKSLRHVAFVGDNKMRCISTSQLYGESAPQQRNLRITIPSLDQSGVIYHADTNTFKAILPTPSSIEVTTQPKAPSAIHSYVNQNGPLVISSMSSSSYATNAAYFIQMGVDDSGVATTYSLDDATRFQTRMSELAQHMISQSTYVFNGTPIYHHSLQLLKIDQSANNIMFLYTINFGGIGAGKVEYATLRLNLVGSVLNTSLSFVSSILYKYSGPLHEGTGNLGPAYLSWWENIGVYEHSDGVLYAITSNPCYWSTVGGNNSEIRLFKIQSNGQFTSTSVTTTISTWLANAVGVHPKYGLYWTSTWYDSNTKALMTYSDQTGTSIQSDRVKNSAEALLTGGTTSTLFILSSRAATGFILYSSDIPVLMNGKLGTVPTQTIDLHVFDPSPANKTFLFYVQWTGTSFELTASLTAIAESATSTYVGFVQTDGDGISTSALKKLTRMDNYRIDDEAPIEGSSIRTYGMLPTIPAYIYDTSTELNDAKATKTPPSQADIFNTWDRTNGNTSYYAGGVGATGDAAAWTFNTNPDRITQPNNTAAWVSFISPTSYSDYTFESTLFSSTGDDDEIGLVAAFARVDGTNIQLSVVRQTGGIAHPNNGTAQTAWNFGFILTGVSVTPPSGAVLTSKMIGANYSNSTGGNGWSGKYSRVRVIRRGNIIKAYCSDFGASQSGLVVLESSEITLDLDAIPELAVFKTSSPYGYTTFSQAATTYYDNAFSGGLDQTKLFSVDAGEVWEYNFTTGNWELSGSTIQAALGYVREVYNPDTTYRYVITQDNVYKL